MSFAGATDVDPPLVEPTVEALVTAARDGDQDAWNALVVRFAPLVWAICRRFELRRLDADDVAQNVWVSLIEHLADLREPAALPGWITTTTRRECFRVLQAARRQTGAELLAASGDDADIRLQQGFEDVERDLERAWENAHLREAFAQLRPRCRELLARLFEQAKPSYGAIASEFDMKIGSIGPTRQRCLDELRRCPAFAALAQAGRHWEGAPDERR